VKLTFADRESVRRRVRRGPYDDRPRGVRGHVVRSVSAAPSDWQSYATKRLVKWRHISEHCTVRASNTSPVMPPFRHGHSDRAAARPECPPSREVKPESNGRYWSTVTRSPRRRRRINSDKYERRRWWDRCGREYENKCECRSLRCSGPSNGDTTASPADAHAYVQRGARDTLHPHSSDDTRRRPVNARGRTSEPAVTTTRNPPSANPANSDTLDISRYVLAREQPCYERANKRAPSLVQMDFI